MLVLSLLGILGSLVMIGFGIAGATKISNSTVTHTDHDSSIDGPLRKSKITTSENLGNLGVSAEASSFHGSSKSVRVQGSFSPADAAAHPKIAVLLMGGFAGFIAAFGLFWFVVNDESPWRWLGAAMWACAAWVVVGYVGKVRSVRNEMLETPL